MNLGKEIFAFLKEYNEIKDYKMNFFDIPQSVSLETYGNILSKVRKEMCTFFNIFVNEEYEKFFQKYCSRYNNEMKKKYNLVPKTTKINKEGFVFVAFLLQNKLHPQSNAQFIDEYFFPDNERLITKAKSKTHLELFRYSDHKPIQKLDAFIKIEKKIFRKNKIYLCWRQYSSSRGFIEHSEEWKKDFEVLAI
jgi:hypothetical protein